MKTLDIAYFPHIFDTILDFADFEAACRLRLTCRAVHKLIEEEWGHVRWNVFSEGEVVLSKRGIQMQTDSPRLRFTSVLDLYSEEKWMTSEDMLDHDYLRPQAIRFDPHSLWYYPMNSHARTLIVTSERDVPGLVDSAGEPANGSRNIVYWLHLDSDVFDFETVGDIPWPADIYFVLSGCPNVGGPVEDLCQSIMCPIDASVKLARHDDVHFYFVDVPSWFAIDTSTANAASPSLPDDDRSQASRHKARRLDQDLTQFESFYNYLLNSARIDGVEEYEGWWPSHKNLKYLSKVHSITREEMRERVGDKAYNLTFAPQSIRASPAGIASDRCS